MKKYLFLTGMAITICHGAFSQNMADVQQVATSPTIDGAVTELDPWANLASNELLNHITKDAWSINPDYSASFKMCFDATNLYLLITVNDPALYDLDANAWENDGTEA